MNRDRERFAEAGAPLVVIGQGTPANAAWFRKEFDLDVDLLVDTDRLAFKAAGTREGGLRDLFGPTVIARGVLRAARSRVMQGRTLGHPAQLGGLMLVLPGNEVPWTHLADDAGDYPPNDEVLEAIADPLGQHRKRPAA